VATMVGRNLVKPYPWNEVFGAQLPALAKAVEAVIPDLRNQALPLLDAVYGLAWNPALVQEKDLPKTTSELLDPKWQGKVALNAAFLNPLPTLAYLHGNDAAIEFARKMMRNKPVLEQGTPAVSRAISVGQAPIGITTYHSALRTVQNGEPQKFRLFDDYVFIFEGYVYVPENAPNPSTARLFLAWLATEGVAIANQFEAVPVASVTDMGVGKLIKEQQERTGAKIAAPSSLAQIRSSDIVRQTITKLISGQIAN
jgi:iron(III) transport system substrate-binding protein